MVVKTAEFPNSAVFLFHLPSSTRYWLALFQNPFNKEGILIPRVVFRYALKIKNLWFIYSINVQLGCCP